MEEVILSQKEKDMLSQYGRFGDDTISIIDGQPEHTNKLEDDIINRKGKVGEQFVKSLGSKPISIRLPSKISTLCSLCPPLVISSLP